MSDTRAGFLARLFGAHDGEALSPAGDLRGQALAISRSCAVAQFAPDGRFVSLNDAFLAILGFSREELRGKGHQILLDPALAGEAKALWDRLMRGQFDSAVYRRLGKDGRERWLDGTYAPLPDASGRTSAVVLVARDVSAQHVRGQRRERTLEALSRQQALAEFSLDGAFLEASEAYLQLLGFAEAGVAPKKHGDVMTQAELASPTYQAMWTRLAQGESVVGRARRRLTQGQELAVHATLIPVRDEHGQTVGVLEQLIDASAEANSEAERTREFALLEDATLSAEFSAQGQLLGANEGLRNLLGLAPRDLPAKPHTLVFDTHQLAHVPAWDRLAQGQAQSGLWALRSKAGADLWMQGTCQPVPDAQGAVARVALRGTDVTAGVRAAREREREALALAAVEALSEYSPAGKLLSANAKFRDLHGYAQGELPEVVHADLVDPKTRQGEPYLALWTGLARGEGGGLRHRRVVAKVAELWLDTILVPVLDEQGQLTKVMEYARDCTQAVMEQALVQAQLDGINGARALVEINPDGRILGANEIFLKLTGYTQAEVRANRHAFLVTPKEAASAPYKELWAKLGRGEYQAGQGRYLAKGGRELWLLVNFYPIIGLDGRVAKIVQYATDVTEQRRRVEDHEGQIAAIRRAQAVIELAPDGSILAVNDNFLSSMGYTAEELLGKNHSVLMHPAAARDPEYQEFWATLRAGGDVYGRFSRVAKGGATLWWDVSYTPILDEAGAPIKVLCCSRDVTAVAVAEEALRHAVAQTQDVVSSAQAGDLQQRIPLDGKSGAVEALCIGVNALVQSLADMVSTVKESTTVIKTAAGEIAAGYNDLSHRTEEQASSLQQTASSIEQLTATVRQNADSARQANGLAVGASDVAVKGGEVVAEVVTTMGSIHESSKKIVDIISVIDGIAFQTNILALNAAVEAARAGEQGRGFAVVATEVRNLAQRSAAAAKEIKALISDSVDKVGQGTKLVGQAGETMTDVVTSVRRVASIIAEIASASAEQSDGIDQVNQAVSQMDTATQQNASLVEQAAASAEQLREQAGELANLVASFSRETSLPVRERRAPDRAQNVTRLPAAKAVAAPRPAERKALPAAKPSQAGVRPAVQTQPRKEPAPRASRPAIPVNRTVNGTSSAEPEWEEF